MICASPLLSVQLPFLSKESAHTVIDFAAEVRVTRFRFQEVILNEGNEPEALNIPGHVFDRS
jgi:hypothetical protein